MSLLNRREALRVLLQDRGDLLVIAGLGAPAYDLATCGDGPLDFPLWGAMGGAAMMGLGLAMAQPQRTVLVVTGDGEMLMGLGSLATIAAQRPPNLRIVVLDNERFGETGQQLTHTAMGTDLAAVARGCGFHHAHTIREEGELVTLRADIHTLQDVLFAVVKVSPEDLPRVLPPRDGSYLAHRMRQALLGLECAEP
ncbi:MAG TPA: thiamine pyrophosphate-dependent enzyme [Ktedonosporobacter sp.]|nr:thiamine pyrophosphate-dependent enzyme [Ktedonosporobacter sp.]